MRITIIILIASMYFNMATAQSPFELNYISNETNIIDIKYNGNLGSVADSELVKLSPFKFLSIGKLKEMSALANGCVCVIFAYKNRQYIIVESKSESFDLSNSNKWIPIGEDDQNNYCPCQNFSTMRNRQSFIIHLENARISIINIKANKVKLFKFVGSTFEFFDN